MSTTPTRRGALAALAGAAVATPAITIAAIADPDAAIHAMRAECIRLHAEYMASDDEDGDEYDAALDRLLAMPARTPAGMLAKLLEVERGEPFCQRRGDIDAAGAAAIAVNEIRQFLETDTEVERVHVVCFGRDVYDAYHEVLQEMVPE